MDFSTCFGFHTAASVMSACPHIDEITKAKKTARLCNRDIVLGYIPLVGTIVGINRLICCTKSFIQNKNLTPKKIKQARHAYCGAIVRGIGEATSLGFLFFIIPDLILSYNRFKGNKNLLIV